MKKILLLIFLCALITQNLIAQPETFYGKVDNRESIKLLMGKLYINDEPAEDDIWICAFDKDGNVVAKEPATTKNGTGEFNLVLYQDDGDNTDNAHGVEVGEKFVLKFYYDDKVITVKTKPESWQGEELIAAPQGTIFYAKVKKKKKK